MNELVAFPDAVTLVRALLALFVVLFLPGYVFLSFKRFGGVWFFKTKKIGFDEWLELIAGSVFVSVLFQILGGMILIFSVGLTFVTAVLFNVLLIGGLLWLGKKGQRMR